MGIDGAGKTTLLYKAKLDDAIFANLPPRGINIELMTPRRGARIQVFDMPGSKLVRHLWQNWFNYTEAIVYVVDSSDRVRIDEAKFELHELLQSPDLRRVPLIVVANKQDKDEAMCADIVSAELELSTIQDRDWSIHSTCAQKGTGISKVFQDVVDKIKAFRHYKKGLSTLNNNNKVGEKLKEMDKDLQFTSIEEKGDQVDVPSLFDSIGKQTDVKNDVAETTSTGNGSGSSDSNPAEYARPGRSEQENSSYAERKDTASNSSSNDSILEKVTDLDDVINEFDSDKAQANVKVTDLDAVSIDSVTDNISSSNASANNEPGNLYEFEANAPIAVV